MFCPKCGEENKDDSAFCVKCGNNLKQAKKADDANARLAEEARSLKEEGIARDDSSKLEESVEAYDKAIERNPMDAALWYEKGVALGMLGRFEEAIDDFVAALKLDPDNKTYKAVLKDAQDSIKSKKDKKDTKLDAAPEKELKEYEVIASIQRLMDKKAYRNLQHLEDDTIKTLEKDGYAIGDSQRYLIKDMVMKHGHTGKFAIDDLIIRKLGGGKKAAIIVTVLLGLLILLGPEIIGNLIAEKITNTNPIVTIKDPANGYVTTAGEPILFNGISTDKEDGEASEYIWSSNIDGEIGKGSAISINILSPGTHTITMTGRDSRGATGTETIIVTINERKLLRELTGSKIVKIGDDDVRSYIRVWEPLINERAPKKGWLEMENPFYKIRVNLDRSYYTLYDKVQKKELLIVNDKVDNENDMLFGSDIGYGDLDGNNLVPRSTTALHDSDGIGRHTILYEDKNSGFILVNTEGWDFQVVDPKKGYDVESEVMFGIFADKPYFIDATEVNNLQTQGFARINDIKSPNEIVKSWVIIGDYDSASINGGDTDHLNKVVYEPFYEVQTLTGEGRKPWHAGSAEISLMFPDHVLVGSRIGGGIMFSLPSGVFRWDDSQDVFGGQVAAEFLLGVEKPQKAVAFSVDPVSRESFFYDSRDYSTVPGYPESMGEICTRYNLECIVTVNAKDYEVKRFAYVISLVDNWYDAGSNKVKGSTWSEADAALDEFYNVEDIIYQQLKSTKPLIS